MTPSRSLRGGQSPPLAPQRIPPGTRDVLPEEMRELRAIGDRMRACFERAGYGEIHTPALEYEETRNKARALFTAIELAQGQEEWE